MTRSIPLAMSAAIGWLVLIGSPARASVPLRLSYETGPAYVAQNDGRYGAQGTSYDADDVGQQRNLIRVERASIELAPGRHRMIFSYLPFEVRTRVTLREELRFRDAVFSPGTVVDHRYLFDGLRFSYLYSLLPEPLSLELGGSFQVRNAEVAFSSADGQRHSAQTDIGPVFALKARLRYAPSADQPWGALEADALSTFGLVGDTSGAIYDVALVLGVPVQSRLHITFTARLYGGGADVPSQQLSNWGNFLSATAGVVLLLP